MIFQCTFTLAALTALIPNNKNVSSWFTAFDAILPKYNITTKNRVAAFLAQTCFESSRYDVLQEDLNYSAEGLLKTFPTHFDAATAVQYAHQSQKIANHVYASRYGNGDEASDDGWTFSGKGIIQVTFRSNYEDCSKFIYGDDRLVQNPELLLQPMDAINSGVWFWQSHNLSDLADVNNFAAITKAINGGLNGEIQREDYYNKLLNLL